MFVLFEWERKLGGYYPFIRSCLVRTKYQAHSYPCEKGCLRQIREYQGMIYGICSEDEKICEDITLSKEKVILYKFDVHKFSGTILEKMHGIPLKISVSSPFSDALICHVGTYVEDKNITRKLYVYFSLLPNQLTAIHISQMQCDYPDFVLFVLGNVPPYLENVNGLFSSRIIDITALFLSNNSDFITNLHDSFSALLSIPSTPPMTDKTMQDYYSGHSKRLENMRRANRAGRENSANAKARQKEVVRVVLPILKKEPKKYSALKLAQIVLLNIDQYKLTFKPTESFLRKFFSKDDEIRALLKPHRRKSVRNY